MSDPCTKEKEIEKVLHAIYGNGENGMRVDLALIKQKVDDMPTPAQLKIYMLVGSGLGVLAGYGMKLLGAMVF